MIAGVGLTAWIIREMRRDRASLHKPDLAAVVKDAKYPDWIIFAVKNVGKGTAFNCVASYQDDEGIKWELKVNIPPIAPNDSVDVRFGIAYADRDRPLGENTWLEIEYSDALKKSYKKRIFEAKRITMLTEHRLPH